tara:strand:- start:2542 stop:2910 length:369 start_codon:yes stop_codon:yes gene_type:complete
LASKIGMSLNFHFCGDKLYQISSSSDPKVCEMHSSYSENEKDTFEINPKSCCDDQIVFVQNNNIEKYNSNQKIEKITDATFLLSKDFSLKSRNFLHYSFNWKPPPKSESNLYIIFNQFMLYG